MAKRPALAGNKSQTEADRITNEVQTRDEALDTEERQVDVMPAEGASDAAKQAAEEGGAPHPEIEDDPRAAIAASADRERGKSFFHKPDEEAEGEDTEDGEEPEAEEPKAEEAKEPVKEPEDDPLVTLKVNGKTIELPRSEVVAMAQKNMAADDNFAESKRLVAEAKQLLEKVSAREPGDSPHQGTDPIAVAPGQPETRQTKRDPEMVRSVVESIQAGTPEEAEAELQRLLDSLTSQNESQSPDQVRQVATEAARAVSLETQAQGDIDRALTANAERFPDIAAVTDPRIGRMIVDDTLQAVVGGLKSVGYSDADLQGHSYDNLVRNYAMLRRNPNFADGRKLKSLEDIVGEVSQDILDSYVRPLQTARNGSQTKPGQEQPARVVVSSERAGRRAQAQPQPRSAPMRTDMTRVGQPNTRQDNSSIVQQMAKERGQQAAG